MFRDVREFIDAVEKLGELKIVNGADPHLEMGAISWVAAESPSCPMLLFDNIPGCRPGFRLAANLLNTPRRMALTLGLPTDLQGVAFIKAWKERIRLERGSPPVEVKECLFKENVVSGEDIDIRIFPSPLWHEKDGGEYFGTGFITVARDPDSGYINYGIYRLQSYDKSTLLIMVQPSSDLNAIRKKYWARGESCPVAVCTGIDPAAWLAGGFYLPFGVSEYEVAAHLRGAPMQVAPGDLTGLPVPATGEIVLEGEMPPPEVESRMEGPFGEFTGYYSGGAVPAPVMRIKRLMYRNNPIMVASPPKRPLPGLNSLGINWRAAILWSDLERAGISGIKGVWQHGTSITIISLAQQYPGHAKQAGLVVAASRNATIVRFIIVLDDDVDPSNLSEVLWAMSTRCEPEEINIVKGTYCQPYDPRMPPEQREQGNLTGSRAIIDACRPYHWRDRFPVVNEVSVDLRAKTRAKWGRVLGL